MMDVGKGAVTKMEMSVRSTFLAVSDISTEPSHPLPSAAAPELEYLILASSCRQGLENMPRLTILRMIIQQLTLLSTSIFTMLATASHH